MNTKYVEVAVAAPMVSSLTYLLPDDCDEETVVGRRVLVPLGKRLVTGYLLGEVPAPVPREGEAGFTVRKINSFLDPSPLFPCELIPFFRWIADYYLYPLGLVIKAALPGGLIVQSGRKLVSLVSEEKLSARCKTPWLSQLAKKGELSIRQTSELLKNKASLHLIEQLQREKLVQLRETIRKDRVGSRNEECYQLVSDAQTFLPQNLLEIYNNDSKHNNINDIVSNIRENIKIVSGIALSVAETKALYFLGQLCQEISARDVPLKELRQQYSGIKKALTSLCDKGLVQKNERRIFRNPFGGLLPDVNTRFPRPEKLSEQQEQILAKVIPAIENKNYHAFLLFGITGSGKTEVYLQAAEKTLEMGRDVIVLVPEIALATQLEGQFVSRFGDQVVLQHSGLTDAEKYDQYCLALSGTAKVVVGARSAIFAPLKNPGLIIVDEEHDGSYKQDDSFGYNGRDLAVVRASLQNCVVVLGSATPSITSFTNARKGKYTLLTMDRRIGQSVLPSTVLVDLTKKGQLASGQIISPLLAEKIEKNLEEKHQTILLMNRRGFSVALLCTHCGTPVQCPHCNVSLTLHKYNRTLLCHYCGYQQRMDGIVCNQCRSEDLIPAGFGTERVEEEISQRFPGAVVCRIDSDVARDRRTFHQILGAMHNREIDILIGTQMIAKGHHFPYVTLVGVIWADGGMSMPDYKAAEKSFQLITQVNGRAGRGALPGEVVIQTLRPEHYAIQYACNNRYLEFYEHECTLRSQPAFPPFVRLVLIRLKGKVESRVKNDGICVVRFARGWIREQRFKMDVLGPAPSPITKVKDNFRFQILLKGESVVVLHQFCLDLFNLKRDILKGGSKIQIDIDPESMM